MKKNAIFLMFFLCSSSIVFSQEIEKRKMRIVENENGKKIEAEFENGQITLLKVNDALVPKEKYADYKEVTDKIQNEINQNTSKNVNKHEIVTDEIVEQTISTKKDGDNTLIIIENSGAEPLKISVTKDGKVQFNGETLRDGSKIKLQSKKTIKTVSEGDDDVEKVMIKKSDDKAGRTKEMKKTIVIKDEKDLEKMSAEADSEDEWLEEELLKDKLITKGSLDFELSENALMINNEKQNDTFLKKYKALFEQKGVKFNEKTKIVIKKMTK